jgi:hypothetical protein
MNRTANLVREGREGIQQVSGRSGVLAAIYARNRGEGAAPTKALGIPG